MKLVMQITAAIFFAGMITWLFWLSVFAAAAPKLAEETSRIMQSHPITFQPPTAGIKSPTITEKPSSCMNFVQMINGERHCLENAPRAEFKLEGPAPLPPRSVPSTAH